LFDPWDQILFPIGILDLCHHIPARRSKNQNDLSSQSRFRSLIGLFFNLLFWQIPIDIEKRNRKINERDLCIGLGFLNLPE